MGTNESARPDSCTSSSRPDRPTDNGQGKCSRGPDEPNSSCGRLQSYLKAPGFKDCLHKRDGPDKWRTSYAV